MVASFPTSLPIFKVAVNNKTCNLTAPYTAGDATINVSDTTGTPAAPGAFHMGTNIIFYTGKTGITFTGCTGGQDGTSDAPQALVVGGKEIIFGPEAHYFTALQQEVNALAIKVGINASAVNTTHDYKLSSVADGQKAVSTSGAQSIAGVKTFTDTPVVTNLRINGDFQDGTRNVNLLALMYGWFPCAETWTYVSATQVKMTGDTTGLYTIGMKVKLDQTTTKSFFIMSATYAAPDTTLLLSGFGIYSVANAPITFNYYSSAVAPPGFDAETIQGFVKARAYASADQDNLVDTTDTMVVLDTESYDVGDNFATNYFTVPVTGYYDVTGQIQFEGADLVVDKHYGAKIFVDPLGVGAPVERLAVYGQCSITGVPLTVVVHDLMLLTCTDKVYLYAQANSGGNLTDLDLGYTFMSIYLVSVT